jgi:hypothetical protein
MQYLLYIFKVNSDIDYPNQPEGGKTMTVGIAKCEK